MRTTTIRTKGPEEALLKATKVSQVPLLIKAIKAADINSKAGHLNIKGDHLSIRVVNLSIRVVNHIIRAGHQLKLCTPIKECHNSFVASLYSLESTIRAHSMRSEAASRMSRT